MLIVKNNQLSTPVIQTFRKFVCAITLISRDNFSHTLSLKLFVISVDHFAFGCLLNLEIRKISIIFFTIIFPSLLEVLQRWFILKDFLFDIVRASMFED